MGDPGEGADSIKLTKDGMRPGIAYADLSKDQQEAWTIFGIYTGFDWMPDDKNIVIWAKGKIKKINIVGVKEASGNIGQQAAVLNAVPEPFNVLSGDDAITLPLIALGGRGLISVVANEIPAETAQLVHAAMKNDWGTARSIQRKYFALMEVNFVESNPIPVKYAMAQMGLLEPVWRLPLVPPLEASRAKIDAVLKSVGVLESVHAS